MKKRVLPLFLALVLCLGLLPHAALAAEGDFNINENGVLTRYTGSGGDVVIPNGVTAIGSYAFESCTNLTSVTIPDGVTSIGQSAFYYCTSLTSVTIGNGVTSIDVGAFVGCTSLTSVTIPNGVTSIGRNTFNGCTSLTDVTIPDSVTSIGDAAFSGCTSLTNVTIPDSVTSIGIQAFYNCTNLTDVAIPDGVTSIDAGVFNGCTSLTNVTIPDSVTSIDYQAFYNCTNLTGVTIPNSVTSIDGRAFLGTPWLQSLGDFAIVNGILLKYQGSDTNVTVPNSVTSIGTYAFQSCTSLTGVTIPNSVTSIGRDAFYYCTSLTDVTIPDSVTSIDYAAFSVCTSLTNVTILNGDAEIDETMFGKIPVTVSAPAGGKVEAYCDRNNIAFVALGSEPAAPAIPDEGTAYTGTQDVWVGDGAVTLHAYILRDEKGDDMNFVKIRDVAAILNGTAAQFEIGWDGSINLEAGKPYTTATGAELTQVFQGDQPYHVGSYPVNVNGVPVSLTTIILTDSGEGEHNYVKLRDLAEALNFNVGWTAETGVTIYPDQPYVKP